MPAVDIGLAKSITPRSCGCKGYLDVREFLTGVSTFRLDKAMLAVGIALHHARVL